MKINIKIERVNRGLSREAMAEAVGVSAETIRRAENGVRPNPSTGKKIADFFGYRVTDIWPVEEQVA